VALSCLGVVSRINRKGSRDELQGTENCFQRSVCVGFTGCATWFLVTKVYS
jgi:hypothetical protein